jgi:hypothetical protein
VHLSCVVVIGVFLLPAIPHTDAAAQDMRVYTTVRAVGENRQDSPILAESLTLFHAGKTYDYMENVGEVIIYEPARSD